jgi:phosphomannomutase / phosphoglucomutase
VTIDGVRAIFHDGWGLIRASNTQPALVLRFEASSAERLKAIRTAVEAELSAVKRTMLS